MQLLSMTGFGRGEASDENYTVVVEIKSVNHRFREIRFKMSSAYNSIELDLKKMLSDKFKRGSFDVFVNVRRSESNSKFDDIDETKVKDFLAKMDKISGGKMQVQPTEFLRGEFMKDQDLSKDENLIAMIKKAYSLSLDNLEESRRGEGNKLVDVIKGHRNEYEENFRNIVSQTDKFQESVEEKLRKRLDELKDEIGVDEPRFLQEVIYYMEKLDVHEEINRINTHLEKFDELLKNGGEAGRQIDFLVQELNRETNTIGSKSNLKDISNSVVQMKVQLEKMREQGLNLE